MAIEDLEGFSSVVGDAFQRHPDWVYFQPALSAGADLADAAAPGLFVTSLAGQFLVALNMPAISRRLVAGPPGCGEMWAHGVVAMMEVAARSGTPLLCTVADVCGDVFDEVH